MNRDAGNAVRPGGQVGNEGPITVQDVAGLLGEAIQAPPGQVGAGTLLEGFTGWDSMGMVAFIWLLEQRTGVKLQVRDLRKCATPACLTQIIHNHLPG